MAVLEIRETDSGDGNCRVWSYPITKDETVIGRGPNKVDLLIPAMHLSRRHTRIMRDGANYYVEDLQNQAGTRLNGADPANTICERTLLRDGDTIWYGSFLTVQFRQS